MRFCQASRSAGEHRSIGFLARFCYDLKDTKWDGTSAGRSCELERVTGLAFLLFNFGGMDGAL